MGSSQCSTECVVNNSGKNVIAFQLNTACCQTLREADDAKTTEFILSSQPINVVKVGWFISQTESTNSEQLRD